MSTEFPMNAHRFEPYKTFRFRVMWDGKYVAGVSKVSSIKQTVETITHRQGGDPNIQHIGPGLVSAEAITLERGITWDKEFEIWARKVFEPGELGILSLQGFRKPMTIVLNNLAGEVVRAYNIHNCWVSEYEMLPELDANSAGYAIERLVIQNEGASRQEIPEKAET
ncbi:phage tail protein [Primorskyibacter sp. 2E107]|uniref:phage tail protein n=1 Tax=Primorskyibacter sp. 2E107 TaxID=3403458 RepID=UPI003AF60FA3